MLNKILKVAALCVSLYSVQSHAALQTIDWKTQGDGLASLDHSTGLEWLDLTVTLGKSLDDVKTMLDTDYQGWRLPTITEMRSLLHSTYQISLTGDTDYVNSTPSTTEKFVNHTLMGMGRNGYVAGLYQINGSGIYAFTGSGQIYNLGGISSVYFNHYRGEDTGLSYKDTGIYLVNDGGITISSINNPAQNINNANSPINNPPVTNVNEHWGALFFGFFALIALFSKNTDSRRLNVKRNFYV